LPVGERVESGCAVADDIFGDLVDHFSLAHILSIIMLF
jgi:hypothetical protein